MTLTRQSPCKVNLLLNILAKRSDGFHELETVLQPVGIFDVLEFERRPHGLQLTCNNPALPVDSTNLVHRAAKAFLQAAGVSDGVRIHLEKNLPLAAGLGGGSGNAAHTLLGLNDLFSRPLPFERLNQLAASLGSDVPFFLQDKPALATGRGEIILPLEPFPALRGASILMIHPGFGISTAWAYQQLAKYPTVLNGAPGRGQKLISLLRTGTLEAAAQEFYNSLETPALAKYPLLAMFQEFLRGAGAVATLMSGSGSTTFALFKSHEVGESARARFTARFDENCWTSLLAL